MRAHASCSYRSGEVVTGLSDEGATVSVYLRSEDGARQAQRDFVAQGIDGVVAQVTTVCLD